MIGSRSGLRRSGLLGAVIAAVAVLSAGCGWQGLNSVPLPGAEGRGEGSQTFHVQMLNVGTLEQNSPVLMNDVVVGSVGPMKLDGWHATLDVSVKRGVVVPANAVASIGQTSLLGSSHLQLQAPPGVAPTGRLVNDATIGLSSSSTYPSTEQTLSSLSVVLNGGGLGQLNDITTEFNNALDGRQGSVRSLLTRLDTLVGTLDDQRGTVIDTIDGLNRFSERVARQNGVLTDALDKLPGALQVLVDQRQNLTTALEKLGKFSDTANAVIDDTQENLVTDLKNLEPTIAAVAKVGDRIGPALSEATVFPFAQYVVSDAVRGDYLNLFATIDFTIPRLRRELLAGTPLGETMTSLPAVVGGSPTTAPYSRDPLQAGVDGGAKPAPLDKPPAKPTPSAKTPAKPAPSQGGGR